METTVENCMACGKPSTLNISFQPGERIYSCSVCGSLVKIEYIPKIFEI